MAANSDRVELDLEPRSAYRRRAGAVAIVGVVLAAAVGGTIGLAAGQLAGLIAAALVGLPVLLPAIGQTRRSIWLADGVLSLRSAGTRSIDLRKVDRVELVVAEMRGKRLVMLVFLQGKRKRITLPVATYAIDARAELDIVALRRLADAFAAGDRAQGLVFAELLVAQLRAEARDEPIQARPLYRLAELAAGRRLAQRVHPDTITQFVATLD